MCYLCVVLLYQLVWYCWQGPFREPREVQLQRYKPFQPTLRVMTDYFSIEKAQKQVKVDELARQITDVR